MVENTPVLMERIAKTQFADKVPLNVGEENQYDIKPEILLQIIKEMVLNHSAAFKENPYTLQEERSRREASKSETQSKTTNVTMALTDDQVMNAVYNGAFATIPDDMGARRFILKLNKTYISSCSSSPRASPTFARYAYDSPLDSLKGAGLNMILNPMALAMQFLSMEHKGLADWIAENGCQSKAVETFKQNLVHVIESRAAQKPSPIPPNGQRSLKEGCLYQAPGTSSNKDFCSCFVPMVDPLLSTQLYRTFVGNFDQALDDHTRPGSALRQAYVACVQ